MSARSLAKRYAAALFDVARKAGSEDRAGQDLTALSALIAGHAELAKVFETPAVPASVKKAVMAAILDASGDVSVEVKRLMLMLAERDRMPILADLASTYAGRLLEARRIIPAEVVTAVPLSAARRAALAAALAKVTGHEVTMTERIDPAIVGGVVARVGSVVYDGSVTRQLERLHQQLTTNN